MSESLANIGAELYVKTFGKFFKIVATFKSQDEANAYMLANPGIGLLDEIGGLFLLARMDDKGIKVPA